MMIYRNLKSVGILITLDHPDMTVSQAHQTFFSNCLSGQEVRIIYRKLHKLKSLKWKNDMLWMMKKMVTENTFIMSWKMKAYNIQQMPSRHLIPFKN